MGRMTAWLAELESVELLPHALAYARRGWAVLPLWWCIDAEVCACPEGAQCGRGPGKHPLTKHGVKDASKDIEQIRAWWSSWPFANIGIATGEPSGILVLDVDGAAGARSMSDLLAQYGRPETYIAAVTGGGGRHVFWRHVPGIANRVRFAAGLDARGTGGYIVAPPSLHSSGSRYAWHKDGHPAKAKLANAPGWGIALMREPVRVRRPFDSSRPKPRINIEQLPAISEGNRNRRLFELASRMRWEGRSDAAIHEALQYINRTKCRPPLNDREISKIAGSACRYQVG